MIVFEVKNPVVAPTPALAWVENSSNVVVNDDFTPSNADPTRWATGGVDADIAIGGAFG